MGVQAVHHHGTWRIVATLLSAIAIVAAATVASPLASGAEEVEEVEAQRTRVGPSSGDLVNVAHRGASGMAPANTLAAFQLALDQQANWIEFDLHLTSDEEIVLVHDTSLTGTTNVTEVFPDRAPWNVRDFTLEEIRQLDAGSWFDPRFAGEPVPTLREALDLIGNRAGVQLDVKSPHLYPAMSERIVEELEAIPGYITSAVQRGKVMTLAFDLGWLEEFRQVAPDGVIHVPMWGAGNIPSRADLEEARTYTDWMITAFDNVANNARLHEDLHDLGFRFGLYTLNDAPRMYEAVDLGASGIATDYPSMLRELIRSGLLDREFDPPEDTRETITFESDHYQIVLRTAPSTAIETLSFAPDGDGEFRQVLNASTRENMPWIGVGAFSPVAPVGAAAEVEVSPDGRDVTLSGVPMVGQPVTVDWTFRFEDEWFDHDMTWHVDGATTADVYQVGWGLDTNLPKLGDDVIQDRERGHQRPFPRWSINWDDDLTVVAAYEDGSAWADANVFYSTAHGFTAWTPLWNSSGVEWTPGEYEGGRWRVGAGAGGPNVDHADRLHAALNGG